jgi:hypothetical protein
VRWYDRILLMLGNQVELWEVLLAAMKSRHEDRRRGDPGVHPARPGRPA